MGAGGGALLQQFVQRPAAQLVPLAAGQETGGVGPGQKFQAAQGEGSAARLAQRPLDGGQRVLLGGLGGGPAVNDGLMPFAIPGGQLDPLRCKADGKIHRRPRQFPAEQFPRPGSGGPGGGGVRLGAHAEHPAVVAAR